jgi:peptidase E
METAQRQIVAFGGGGFSMESGNPLLDDYVLGLTGAERPRVCFLPSASGDADHYIVRFYRAFSAHRCEASHISLFRREQGPEDLRRHLLSQDLIYVGGGSMVNLLAVWEAHDIASILSLAWRRGIVLAGQSAGAMCWFEAGITKSSGRPLAAAGLGLLSGSLCVHYNNEPERRAVYLAAVAEGTPGGYGLDDYAGLLWEGEGTPSALTARRGARAYQVTAREGKATESPLPARFLPAPAPAALREDIAEFRRIKTMRKRAGWLG